MIEPKVSDPCQLETCGVRRAHHYGISSMPGGHFFVEADFTEPPSPEVDDDSDDRYDPDHHDHGDVCDYTEHRVNGNEIDPMHRLYHLQGLEDELMPQLGADASPELLLDALKYQVAKAQVEATTKLAAETELQRVMIRHMLTLLTIGAVQDSDLYENMEGEKPDLDRAMFANAAISLSDVLPGMANWLHKASGFTITDSTGTTYMPPDEDGNIHPVAPAAPPFSEEDAAKFNEILGNVPTVPERCDDCYGTGKRVPLGTYDVDDGMCMTCRGTGQVNGSP